MCVCVCVCVSEADGGVRGVRFVVVVVAQVVREIVTTRTGPPPRIDEIEPTWPSFGTLVFFWLLSIKRSYRGSTPPSSRHRRRCTLMIKLMIYMIIETKLIRML